MDGIFSHNSLYLSLACLLSASVRMLFFFVDFSSVFLFLNEMSEKKES